MNTTGNDIGNLLRLFREVKGWTQRELAERLSCSYEEFGGINTVTVSRWETGATVPAVSKRKRLMTFFLEEGFMDHSQCREEMERRYWRLLEPLSVLFNRRYQYIIGNTPLFDLEEYRIKQLCRAGMVDEAIQHLLDIERATNPGGYYSVGEEKMAGWCRQPGTFAEVCERKGQYLGHFVMLKIPDWIAEEIAYHRRS